MPITYKILSVRIPVTTVAGCFHLLEEATGTLRVPMAKAVRTVIEGAIEKAVADGRVPDMTNDEALEYISKRTTNETAGMTINVDAPDFTKGMAQASLPQRPMNPETDHRLSELIAPHVREARKKVDQERMPFAGSGEDFTRMEEDEGPPAPVTDKPPWDNVPMVPASDLMAAKVQSPLISNGFNNSDQLMLLAGRIVLHTSIGTPGGSRFEKLLEEVYSTFRAWVLQNPSVEIPVSISIDAKKSDED